MTKLETNPFDARLIDQIVREVLERLGGLNGRTASVKAASAKPAALQPAAAATANGAEKLASISDRVVSVATLDGRLDGAASVVLARGAILTPAARDLLRERKINVSYATTAAGGPRHSLVVGVAETGYEAAALVRAAMAWTTGVERLANSGLHSVVDELADAVVKSGHLGLLLTGAAPAATCLANRQRGVRAVAAADRGGVVAAVAGVGANLLVIDPAGKSLFQLQQSVQEFVRGGVRQCPPQWAGRLA